MKNSKNLKQFWNKKKIFITGHTGFKGTWLCLILNHFNSSVHGYSLKPKKNSLFFKTQIHKDLASNTYANINNLKELKKRIKQSKCEILFHLAAQPLVIESYKKPIKTFKTNFIGTLNILECIKDVNSIKSVVIVTSDKVYKINKKNTKYKEIDILGGNDPYSASKAAAEMVVECYIKSYFDKNNLNNRISTARAGNVIGGGDFAKDRLLPDIFRSINNKKNIILRNPNHIRPWQHVLDPLMGYLTLSKKQYENKINNNIPAWNFGPDQKNFKRVIDIVRYINKKINFKYKINKKNKFEETSILKLDSSKSYKELNWFSKWDFHKALNETINWNIEYKNGLSARAICKKQILMYINNK